MRACRLELLVLVAALGLFTLTASGRCDRLPDEYEVYLQAESLWERRTLAIDQVEPAVFFGRVGRGGHRWAPYGPGAAFLALPHHALGRATAAVAGLERDGDPVAVEAGWRPLVMAYTSLASAAWAALAVAATLRAARALGASPGRALLVAGLLAVATPLWPYATTFFSEASSAALLAVTVAALLEGRRLLAAATVAALVLVKATNVFAAPALLLLAAWPRAGEQGGLPAAVRRAGAPLLGVVVACVVHAEWNEWRFNDGPLQLGYEWGEMLREGEPPRAFLLPALPRGLVVLKAGVDADAEGARITRELVQRVRDEVGAVASLRQVDIVGGLPKTRSGKILRKTMREMADGKTPTIPGTIEDASVLDRLAGVLADTKH